MDVVLDDWGKLMFIFELTFKGDPTSILGKEIGGPKLSFEANGVADEMVVVATEVVEGAEKVNKDDAAVVVEAIKAIKTCVIKMKRNV